MNRNGKRNVNRHVIIIALVALVAVLNPWKKLFPPRKKPQVRLPGGDMIDLRSPSGQAKIEQLLREDAIKNHRPTPETLKSLGKKVGNGG